MRIEDLGLIPYRDAWKIQEERHASVLEGGDETLLLLEHPPVITLGRRVVDAQKNLLTPPHILQQMGVEVVESDRGGDITFHGPGQLVVYPIIRLNAHALSVGAYVRKLEEAVIATLADFSIHGYKDACAIGVWVDLPQREQQKEGVSWPHEPPITRVLESGAFGSGGDAVIGAKGMPTPAYDAIDQSSRGSVAGEGMAPQSNSGTQCSPPTSSSKICALGVRIKRGISLHGIALNLTTNLAYFNLINPCGLSRPVTSIQNLLGQHAPRMDQLKQSLASHMLAAFA
jgi:lipoyl(octanoyl) transferase